MNRHFTLKQFRYFLAVAELGFVPQRRRAWSTLPSRR